ncbi:MAG TPA: hypothetical protein VGP06_06080 [Janthinobacterium sp.]|jgi:hypothetical protein|nr:hypothetical protein [Janthinobacterium sp.]
MCFDAKTGTKRNFRQLKKIHKVAAKKQKSFAAKHAIRRPALPRKRAAGRVFAPHPAIHGLPGAVRRRWRAAHQGWEIFGPPIIQARELASMYRQNYLKSYFVGYRKVEAKHSRGHRFDLNRGKGPPWGRRRTAPDARRHSAYIK